MKAVAEIEKPVWGAVSNTEKMEYIAALTEKKILPEYSKCADFMEFFNYLSSQKAFCESSHYYRYLNTFGAIAKEMGEISGKKIIETGGASPILSFLARKNDCFVTESDLRTEIDVETNFADISLSFEVAEHIKDQAAGDFSDVVLFNESGIRSFALELHRATKIGGSLFLTTPNCCSYRAIENAVNHEAPYIFRPHVREYSKAELARIFDSFGIKNYLTQFNFFMLDNQSKFYDKLFEKQGWSTEDRGDDHFFHFTK